MRTMNGLTAVRTAVYGSEDTQRAIAGKLGKSPRYLSMFMVRDTTPSVDNFAKILGACGWEVQVVTDKGETIRIKP